MAAKSAFLIVDSAKPLSSRRCAFSGLSLRLIGAPKLLRKCRRKCPVNDLHMTRTWSSMFAKPAFNRNTDCKLRNSTPIFQHRAMPGRHARVAAASERHKMQP